MYIDKKKRKNKNANNSFGISTNASNGANAISANKDKNASTGISATAIDKVENIDDSFDNVIASEMTKNAEKQQKMSKFKLFIAIINCKKSYLVKKKFSYKTSSVLFYILLIFSNLKSPKPNSIIYNLFVDLN